MSTIRKSLLALPLLCATSGAMADGDAVLLDHAWARPTPGAGTTGAAYFTLTASAKADRLVSVSTPVAKTAELHESIDDHGVMNMRAVPSLALEPGKPVMLKPGGYHVMLMGLQHPLKPGESFPLTLTFEHAAPITAAVTVQTPGARPPADGKH